MKTRHHIKKRLLAVIVALLALFGLMGPAGANYVVMPSQVAGFVNSFNAKSTALGLRYVNMHYTHISYSKKSAAFALRGPEGLDYAFSDTMELALQGEHDNQLVTSVTITAAPLTREFASTAAYRQEYTMAALITLESLVMGVTRYEAARVLASLSMPFDASVLSSALSPGYGQSTTGAFPYTSGYSYSYPTVLMDKGTSVSETLNSYPLTLTAEIESNGHFTMTAKLAGIYPYPTASLYPNSYPYKSSHTNQNQQPALPSADGVIMLSPGVSANVRIGDEFIVRLEYTEGDGFDWKYNVEGARLSYISDHKYTTSVQPFMTKGVHEWRFSAPEFGSSTLAFAYVNSSENMAQGALFYVSAY